MIMYERPSHGNATVSNTSMSENMRQRSRQACGPCRQRKRKCDGQFPSSTCTGYGYDCQYMDDPSKLLKRRTDAATLLPAPPAKKPRAIESQDRHTRMTLATSALSNGILEPSKLRYMGRHSSVAFPMTVGLEMQAMNPPRLHSFAYNPGIRTEPGCEVNFDLTVFISWDKVKSLMDVYTLTVHPVFGILDMDRLSHRGKEHWHGKAQGLGFEALISGVIGLGSLFSSFLSENQEMRIVRHAKEILEDASISRVPSIDKIAGWILRTIYVRTTSRPHCAWMCSCTTMHLVEAAGLHQPLDAIMLTTGDRDKKALEDIAETRERIAQTSQCLNIIIAYDYGRSVVDLRSTWKSTWRCEVRQGDLTPQLFNLVGAVPLDCHVDDTARREELITGLEKVTQTLVEHDFLILIKADLAFSIFRRLRVLERICPAEPLNRVLSVGLLALPAARRLMIQNHPWWNVVGTVFQFICVLIAIDTTDSLEMISEAMETLEIITEQLNTHLATEALHTARHLVHASLKKKQKDTSILERVPGILTMTNPNGTERQWPASVPFLDSFQQTPSMDLDYLFGLDLLL